MPLNSGRIAVCENAFYCGSGSNTPCQLALKSDIPDSVTPYVHPTTKQCNYVYTHPTAKQCNYSVSIINNLTSSSTTAALSANQGRLLNQKIAELETKIEDSAAPTVVGSGSFRIPTHRGSNTVRETIPACDYVEITVSPGDTPSNAQTSGICAAGYSISLCIGIDDEYPSIMKYGDFSLSSNGTTLSVSYPGGINRDADASWVAWG